MSNSSGTPEHQEKRPSPPLVQEFRFIDSSGSARGPRRGRRDVRSFVMQNARRQRPWSTSKNAAKNNNCLMTPDIDQGYKSTANGTKGRRSAHLAAAFTSSSRTSDSPSFPNQRQSPSQQSNEASTEKIFCVACEDSLSDPSRKLCNQCATLLSVDSGVSSEGSPAGFVGEGIFDPFDTLPVKPDRTVVRLLNHYLHFVLPTFIPIDIQRQSNAFSKSWFKSALTNAAFMHSMLCFAALHSYVLGRGSFSDILHHRAQAVSAVNSNFSDRELGVADCNIAAVFTLLCIEESMLLPLFKQELEGREDGSCQRMLHLNGLSRMLQMRGGLQSLHSNPCVQALILWHSTAHFVASFYAPYASLTAPDGSPMQYFVPSGITLDPIEYSMLDLCYSLPLNRELVLVISDLCRYAADLRAWYNGFATNIEALELQTQAVLLQYRLVRSHNTWQEVFCPVERTMCLSLLAFVCKCSEPLDQSFDPLHYTAVKKLQASVKQMGKDDWGLPSDVLIWMYSMAAVASKGSVEEAFFVKAVNRARRAYDVRTYDSYLSRLKNCLWVDFRLNVGAEWLWKEMIEDER